MSDYGNLVEVIAEPRMAALTVDAAVSDTELLVDDAGDFNASSEENPDGGGGTLQLNGVQLAYTDVTWGETEDDNDVILLAAPLAVAADEGDAVTVVAGGLPAEDWYAVVDMGEGDNVAVPLTFAQRAQWPLGMYEPTPVQVSDDHEQIEDAPGRPGSVAGRVAAWNRDQWTAAGDDVDSPFRLTYLPIPDSLMVYQNGVRLENDQFTLVGLVVTPLAAAVKIKSTDDFTAYYDRDPAAEVVGTGVDQDVPTITLVGTNTVVGTTTSLALPSGTQAGDLIVVASIGFDSNGTTDARLAFNSIDGAGVLVAWGPEDGSADALAIHPVSAFGYAASIVAVYRGVQVVDWASTQIASSPMVLPTFAAAFAAIGVVTGANGSTAGLLGHDTTASWTNNVEADGTKAHVSINSWESVAAATSPAGNFNLSGDVSGAVQTTLLLGTI